MPTVSSTLKVIEGVSGAYGTGASNNTPVAVAREMVNKLDVDWSNPNLKILDPCCGFGTFLVLVYEKLREHGHSPKHIVENMIYGNDINKAKATIAASVLSKLAQNDTTIYNVDALEGGFNDMEFDVVLGNPPYQRDREVRNTGAPLWPEFVQLSMDIIKDNGIAALVTPATWMNKSRSGAWKTVKNYDLTYCDPDVKWAFPDLGNSCTFSVMHLVKRAYSGKTSIKNEFDVDIVNDIIPGNNRMFTKGNIEFLCNNKPIKLEVYSGPSDPSINSDHWSEEKTDTHIYETYYSGQAKRRSMYCDKMIGHYGQLKLILANSGNVYKTNEITTKGAGRQTNYILGDQDYLEKVLKALSFEENMHMAALNSEGAFKNPLANLVRID